MNRGFLFEISETSYHAVRPVLGDEPRLSLILTFTADERAAAERTWFPFPLQRDLQAALSTAGFMGVHESTFEGAYDLREYESTSRFRDFVGGNLDNAPSGWSYASSCSMNVDEHGVQSAGTDKEELSV